MFTMAATSGWLGWYIMNNTNLLGIDISRLVLGIVVASVCGVIGCVVSLFFTAHMLMVLRGVTTIEVFEKGHREDGEDESCLTTLCCPPKDPQTGKPLAPGSIYRFPTIGDNLRAAFGDNVWMWWLPTMPIHATGSSDGMIYQTVIDLDRKAVEDGADSPLIRRP